MPEGKNKASRPILGQEAICPDGLGRVADFGYGTTEWIRVDTYIDNRSCHWAAHNVELIDPRCCRGNNLYKRETGE